MPTRSKRSFHTKRRACRKSKSRGQTKYRSATPRNKYWVSYKYYLSEKTLYLQACDPHPPFFSGLENERHSSVEARDIETFWDEYTTKFNENITGVVSGEGTKLEYQGGVLERQYWVKLKGEQPTGS